VSPPPPGPIATGPIFLDSNVLLYSISADPRAEIARRALAVGDVISVQVLNEFANVVRRKQVLSVAEIRDAEDRFCPRYCRSPWRCTSKVWRLRTVMALAFTMR